jgi:hypothetical protein
MESLLDWLLAGLALLGHTALAIGFFNRLHAIGMRRKPRRLIELALLFGYLGAILWYAANWWSTETSPFAVWYTPGAWPWRFSYADLCLLAAAAIVPCWLWPRMVYRVPHHMIAYEATDFDPATLVGPIPLLGAQARILSLVPGNEILKLQVAHKTLRLPALPAGLDGLTITHLSDLHFTGEIGREYYDYVIDQAVSLASDVVILSGDIIESAACEPWISQTLGRVEAPLSKYFVLGNHDKRMPNIAHVRKLMGDAGFVDLGGRAQTVVWRGCPILLAGNERPWFSAPTDAALSDAGEEATFKLLVSHSPDQFAWARAHGFDLMLAGHNHGGQICFPLFGPLVAPSLYGTRYAGGLYFEPPTLLHVSRGISGEHPIRVRCLPELAQLTLTKE